MRAWLAFTKAFPSLDDSISDIFRNHLNTAAWAFFSTNAAALAVIILKLVLSWPNFKHCIIRADAEAVVTPEAVTTAHTAPRLKNCTLLV